MLLLAAESVSAIRHEASKLLSHLLAIKQFATSLIVKDSGCASLDSPTDIHLLLIHGFWVVIFRAHQLWWAACDDAKIFIIVLVFDRDRVVRDVD